MSITKLFNSLFRRRTRKIPGITDATMEDKKIIWFRPDEQPPAYYDYHPDQPSQIVKTAHGLSPGDLIVARREERVKKMIEDKLTPMILHRCEEGMSDLKVCMVANHECAMCASYLNDGMKDHCHVWLDSGDTMQFWEQKAVASLMEEELLSIIEDAFAIRNADEHNRPFHTCTYWFDWATRTRGDKIDAPDSNGPRKVTVESKMLTMRVQTGFGLFETRRQSAVVITCKLD